MTDSTDKCGSSFCQKERPGNLLVCSGCKKASYCSKDCQKKGWKQHKTYCQHVSSGGASSASLDPLDYYKKIAAHEPAARALASEINLPIPTPGALM